MICYFVLTTLTSKLSIFLLGDDEVELDKLLERLRNHKVLITKIGHEEGEMRDTEGILVDFDKDCIHLRVWDSLGEKTEYYLNRHAAILFSVVDLGISGENKSVQI